MSDPWIKVAARTVVGAAEQFERLKSTARELDTQARASGRGYFTPAEDEAVRHMLVSYTSTRAALLELIASTELDRRAVTAEDDAGRRAFVAAYAAAAVLVDAARFLRDQFDDNPVVRAKLNEPEPAFGIPAGAYDAVNDSLTGPRHVYRLHQANVYYDTHRDVLTTLGASDDDTARLLAVIARLRDRLDVSKRAYASALAFVTARGLAESTTLSPLRRALYAVQEAGSRLVSEISTSPGHRHALPPGVAQCLADLLRPGDVLITRKEHALTNYFLPGYWPHGALYIGTADELTRLGVHEVDHVRPRWPRVVGDEPVAGVPDDEVPLTPPAPPRRVVEALGDGVWVRSVASPLASDAVAVIRPRLGERDIATGLARALFHDGKPYDYDFDFTRSDRLVCTEVVYRAYDGLGDVSLPLTRRTGRMTLAAEDLLDDALHGRHFDLVAVFCPARSDEVQTGDAMADTLRATMGPRPA
ncbi:MAG: hypothetical protein GC159_07245 [Phycisphaera sp.]|nr:hypothetical protein [Phycisphaera sp.]